MVALRLSRVLLILMLLGIALLLVDQAMVWAGMPAYMRQVASGLAAGALVFLLAYRGATVIRFALRGGWTHLNCQPRLRWRCVELVEPPRRRLAWSCSSPRSPLL